MNQLLSILSTVAPTVASALGGPLAGVAISAIGKVLGIDQATTESVTQAVADGKLTPDHIAELRKLELQYQNDEKERGFKYSELEFKDRDSARQMQIATQSPVPAILTYLITGGFFGVLGWMLFDDTIVNSQPILIMLGSLGTAWTACISYWFGTTRGSENKNVLLAQSVPAR